MFLGILLVSMIHNYIPFQINRQNYTKRNGTLLTNDMG